MSGRRRYKDKWSWLWAIPVVLSFVAGASFIGASFADHEIEVIESSPAVAEATVVGVETHRGRRGRRSYEPTVQFVSVAGETRTVGLDRVRDSGYYEVGDTLTIRYATSNPEYSYDTRRPPTPQRSWAVGWVTAPLAIGGGLFAAIMTRRESRRKAHGLGDS